MYRYIVVAFEQSADTKQIVDKDKLFDKVHDLIVKSGYDVTMTSADTPQEAIAAISTLAVT